MYRYIIYNRISTAMQNDNSSIQHQEKMSKTWGEQQGWHYVDTVSYQESGARPEREGVEEALSYLRSKRAELVVFAKVDRVGRNQPAFKHFFETIFTLGGKVAITYEGKVFNTYEELQRATVFQRAVAEHEWLTTKERTDQGKLDHLERGSFLKKPDYGYTTVKEVKEGVKINVPEPLDEEVRVLTEIILPIFLDGTPRTQIVRHLNEEGVPSRRRGSQWTIPPLTKILERIGRYTGEVFEYTHKVRGQQYTLQYRYPPIINAETAMEVEKKLTIKPRDGGPGPFKGLVICSGCGMSGVTRSVKEKHDGTPLHSLGCVSATTRHYYVSIGKEDSRDSCSGTVSHTVLSRYVKAFLESPEGMRRHLDRLLDSTFSEDRELESRRDREDELLGERSRLQQRTLTASDEGLISVLRTLNTRLKEVDTELDKLSKETLAIQRGIDERKRTLARLGIETDILGDFVFDEKGIPVLYNVAEAMDAQYKRVEDSMGELAEALDREDWPAVNSKMFDLGLRISVDFSEPDYRARWDTITVSLTPPTPPSEPDKVYKPYEL